MSREEHERMRDALAEATLPIPCRQEDSRLWLSDRVNQRREAAQRCEECPAAVATACRALAEATDADAGVWGGVDYGQPPARRREPEAANPGAGAPGSLAPGPHRDPAADVLPLGRAALTSRERVSRDIVTLGPYARTRMPPRPPPQLDRQP